MSYCERHTVSITTAADGSATGYTPAVTGKVATIIYTKVDFDNTADFAITCESTAQSLWTESNVTASKTVAPMQPTFDGLGVASLYAAGGEPVEVPIYVANDRVKILIAQGGNVKTATFHVVIA